MMEDFLHAKGALAKFDVHEYAHANQLNLKTIEARDAYPLHATKSAKIAADILMRLFKRIDAPCFDTVMERANICSRQRAAKKHVSAKNSVSAKKLVSAKNQSQQKNLSPAFILVIPQANWKWLANLPTEFGVCSWLQVRLNLKAANWAFIKF